MAHDSLPGRVAREIEVGRHWRAKELLQGAIRTYGYRPDLFEQYGQLLLRMGDTLEAGKYLFLSGIRRADYDQAIVLFVQRFTRRNPAHLYYAFPAKARLGPPNAYPSVVAEELLRLGVPSNLRASRRVARSAKPQAKSGLLQFGCSVIMLIAGILMVLGIVFIVQAVR